MEPTARNSNSLRLGQLERLSTVVAATYRVVAFMVTVKLIEARVKIHVGRVMEVKVMIQYSKPGMTLKVPSKMRARRPNEDEGDGGSAVAVAEAFRARELMLDDMAALTAGSRSQDERAWWSVELDELSTSDQ